MYGEAEKIRGREGIKKGGGTELKKEGNARECEE
jgi:hypothetical protein